jgi:hypothetical protein
MGERPNKLPRGLRIAIAQAPVCQLGDILGAFRSVVTIKSRLEVLFIC